MYSVTLGSKTIPLLVNVPVLVPNLLLLGSCSNFSFNVSLVGSEALFVSKYWSLPMIGATTFLVSSSLFSLGLNIWSYIVLVVPDSSFANTSTLYFAFLPSISPVNPGLKETITSDPVDLE